MLRSVLFALVATAAWGSSALADYIPPCAPPSNVAAIRIPDEMPEALRKTMNASLGKIALPGAKFDATDVIMYGVGARYILAWKRGDKWLVATERGGIGYSDPMFLYRLQADGGVTLLETRVAFPPTVCTTAWRMIRD
jgi:hypothetical protein